MQGTIKNAFLRARAPDDDKAIRFDRFAQINNSSGRPLFINSLEWTRKTVHSSPTCVIWLYVV